MSLRKLARGLCLVLIVAVSSINIAFADDVHMPSVDALILKSGLQRQVSQLPEVIQASFESRVSQESGVDQMLAAKVKDIMFQAFDPQILIKAFKDNLNQGLTQQDLSAVLAWLDSPLGQKITQLEESASSGEAYNQMQAFARELEKNPPSIERKNVLNQLDQAAHISQYSIQMKVDMIKVMAQSLAFAGGQADFSMAVIDAQVDQSRLQIEAVSQQETLVSGLFTYQSLSDEELRQYIEFYKTPAGQKYADVVIESLRKVFEDSSRVMGEKIGALIADKNKVPVR